MNRGRWALGGLAVALAVVMVCATAVGTVGVPLSATGGALLRALGIPNGSDPQWDAIIVLVRLPRVLGAALVGAALATAGAALQALLRNPLADAGLLGVSGGAGFGAVTAIGFGMAAQGVWWTPLFAVVGALTAAALILGLSFRAGRLSVFTVLLAGIAVSAFFGAATSLVLTFVSRDSVLHFVFWAMGSLASVRWDPLALAAGPVLAGAAGLALAGRHLNLLLLGDVEARSLGVDVVRTRLVLLVLVAVVTAGAVSVAGPVGFVGLMVPPMLRLLVGPDNRLLVPASALGGAVFLVVCDLLARVILPGQEISVGIVTALVGAPYFLFLLLRRGAQEGAP